jgi:hypothetical protein
LRDFAAVFAFVFWGGLIAVVVIGALAAQQRARKDALTRIARRFHGQLHWAVFFGLPQLRFRHSGVHALLTYTWHGKHQRHTHLQINWPDRTTRLETYPQGVASRLRQLWGMEDIRIFSPQFDADFLICGSDRAAARTILNAEVQQRIYALAKVGAGGFWSHNNIYVAIRGGVLQVTKPTDLTNYDDLARFITLSLELFDQALATRATGIEYIEAPSPPAAEQSQCQVCGDDLTRDIVLCRRCRTPHHRDCWEYFGGCSTYACQEKHFIEPPRKK